LYIKVGLAFWLWIPTRPGVGSVLTFLALVEVVYIFEPFMASLHMTVVSRHNLGILGLVDRIKDTKPAEDFQKQGEHEAKMEKRGVHDHWVESKEATKSGIKQWHVWVVWGQALHARPLHNCATGCTVM
jgi:hypothetical protein